MLNDVTCTVWDNILSFVVYVVFSYSVSVWTASLRFFTDPSWVIKKKLPLIGIFWILFELFLGPQPTFSNILTLFSNSLAKVLAL